jgi:uncharacterized membrane protein required for colicin V production
MTSGSPVWQMVFLSFACVLILFEIVRGWRLGVIRQLVRAFAIVAAYASAIFGGKLLVPIVRPFFKMPDIVLAAASGAVLALLVYFTISTVGSILFKKTGQQNSGGLRFLYGICGAASGGFFGLFTVWLIVIAIRSVGAIADAHAKIQASRENTFQLQRTEGEVLPQQNEPPLADSLAKLKNSIELGPIGEIVKGADVVPATTYETLGKVGHVVSNPESAQRFLSYPGAKELTENPKIVALRDDPEIIRTIQEGRIFDLLQNPRIIEAVNDPALANQLKTFQFQRALDYAAGH